MDKRGKDIDSAIDIFQTAMAEVNHEMFELYKKAQNTPFDSAKYKILLDKVFKAQEVMSSANSVFMKHMESLPAMVNEIRDESGKLMAVLNQITGK